MGSQTWPSDAHVLDHIESYLLGTLDDRDEFAVEDHLLRCSACRAECDDLEELSLMVATLPSGIAQEIAEATGPGPAVPHLAAVRDRPVDHPPAVSRSWGRVLVAAAAALVLGVGIGVAGWAWLGPSTADNVPVGNQSVNGLPAQLSLNLVDRADGGVDVQAVVVGIQPGLNIELLALTEDQRVVSITQAAAVGGPQRLVGTMPANTAKILLFVVVDSRRRVLALTLP